jgi:hypothetical protein
MAFEHMDQYLFEKYGQDYVSVKTSLEAETSLDPEDLQFDEENFGKEPLEGDAPEDEIVAFEQAFGRKVRTSNKRIRMKRFVSALQRLDITHRLRVAGIMAVLT